MDNVITDLRTSFIQECIKLGCIIKEDFQDYYDFKRGVIVPEYLEINNISKYIFTRPFFWACLQPMSVSIYSVIEDFNKNFDVHILTTPYFHEKERCMREKLMWIKEHLPFLSEKVIFSDNKKEFCTSKYDIIIEDNVDNLNSWPGYKIKYWHPYNKDCECDMVIYNWDEIVV